MSNEAMNWAFAQPVSKSSTAASLRHYVYLLYAEDSGDFYIGVRSCSREPETDRQYMGSGRWPTHCAFNGVRLRKEIYGTYESRSAAEAAELELIDLNVMMPNCRNSWKTASPAFKAAHRGFCESQR